MLAFVEPVVDLLERTPQHAVVELEVFPPTKLVYGLENPEEVPIGHGDGPDIAVFHRASPTFATQGVLHT